MKKRDAIKQIREYENAIEVDRLKKLRAFEAKTNLENIESNYNRARSITVGTAFGGTAEIMMRGDGGRHLWCLMQPVEVIEFIHQLAANVGCNIQLTPRKDFASWRDWRVSEAEKKHLNGHPPFVNDMAVFQQLGASGFNEEEAKRIMDILANTIEFANEKDNSKIVGQETKSDGAPAVMIGEEDGLIHNKLILQNKKVVYMSGGNGGLPKDEAKNETMATKKPKNGRKLKQSATTS